ncbi:unnamed protein product [marine sediment metagenome]|uniref:Uncharacterized protein n=1 Tax=marine sediment metagenome TaxID=412755 RepID=X0VP70_9ZZZZ
MKKHNTRCTNAKTDRKNCKCRCKGLLHGDKNNYKDFIVKHDGMITTSFCPF